MPRVAVIIRDATWKHAACCSNRTDVIFLNAILVTYKIHHSQPFTPSLPAWTRRGRVGREVTFSKKKGGLVYNAWKVAIRTNENNDFGCLDLSFWTRMSSATSKIILKLFANPGICVILHTRTRSETMLRRWRMLSINVQLRKNQIKKSHKHYDRSTYQRGRKH